MRDRPVFIDNSKEFEPVNNPNSLLAEDYARQDGERLVNPQNYMNKIVYDCVDGSPYYEGE
jgi:hypothetical protein